MNSMKGYNHDQWLLLVFEYFITSSTQKEIAEQYEVSQVAISKSAKKYGKEIYDAMTDKICSGMSFEQARESLGYPAVFTKDHLDSIEWFIYHKK